jgi:small subunit ribosomal protein S10e
LVVHDDKAIERHPHIPYPVPNLHVIRLMRTFESKGFVKKQFAWRFHYFFLTNEGVTFLREYLHLPDTIVPNTQKVKGGATQQLKGYTERKEGGFQKQQGGYKQGGNRREYRKDDQTTEKSAGRGRGFGSN